MSAVHKVREAAGVPNWYAVGTSRVRLVSGKFSGEVKGVRVGGVLVGKINEENGAVTWHQTELAAGVLKTTPDAVERHLTAIRETKKSRRP